MQDDHGYPNAKTTPDVWKHMHKNTEFDKDYEDVVDVDLDSGRFFSLADRSEDESTPVMAW